MNDPDWEFRPANPEPPRYLWLIFAMVVVSVGLLLIGIARAADFYVITVYQSGKHYDETRPTHFALGGVVYESKVACDVAITRVRVHLSGVKLQCNPQR